MKSCFLYKITNTVNGKMYIGITQNPEKRLRFHLYGNCIHNSVSYIKRAVKKYGAENFTTEILCEGSRDYIADLEVKAIELYKTRGKGGYNIKPGGEKGAGYSMHYTNRDKFQYASGFWFPNVRSALKSLNMDKSTFAKRRKNGTLGDIVHEGLKQNWEVQRVYVAGFWWPNIFIAMQRLNKTQSALIARIKKGSVEQGYCPREQCGENNHMFGIAPENHPSAKAVVIDNILYTSIKEATAATGFSKFIITTRIKEGHPNFAFN